MVGRQLEVAIHTYFPTKRSLAWENVDPEPVSIITVNESFWIALDSEPP